MAITPLQSWSARSRPPHCVLSGRYVRLEPIDPARHAAELYQASNVPDKADKFRWMFEAPPTDEASFRIWVEGEAAKRDPFVYAIIDLESGKVAGRQALMRVDVTHGVIEIGSIYWGPRIARQRGATEALYLFLRHAFDDLGYRRVEWKCNDENAPSKRAAERFGFTYEGVFRQHMVLKGANRDTAWFSMLDGEWPRIRDGFERWLRPENFGADGQQRQTLGACLQEGA